MEYTRRLPDAAADVIITLGFGSRWTWSVLRVSRFILAFLLLDFLCLAGCSGGSPCSVSGQVTFGGKPIPEGNIKFDPAEESQGSAGSGKILDGRFEIPLDAGMHAGKYLVSITANKKSGRTVKQFDSTTAKMEEIVQYIPDRYNLQSQLQADLTPGENTQDFALDR